MFGNLLCLNACDIVMICAGATLLLVKGRTPTDMNILGNLVVSIGSLLLTVAALEDAKTGQPPVQNEIY